MVVKQITPNWEEGIIDVGRDHAVVKARDDTKARQQA